jgi:endonuclease/exonuclease/phosphatase family metal-dependent hydrolase
MDRHHRLLVALLTLVALLVGNAAAAAPPQGPPVGPDRQLTVMTRNVYFGADLTPVLEGAQVPNDPATPQNETLLAVLAGATAAYVEAAQSDFGFRAAAIADEIAATRPALVGVQESTVWGATALDPTAPSLLLNVDFLAEIQKALADRGLHYEVVAEVAGFDATLPLPVPGINAQVTLTISDVLLRDASLPASRLRITGVTSGTYTTSVPPLVVPGLGALPFPRQWIAADVVVRGVPARVITTHLESVSDEVGTLQAAELLAGPAATDRPTLVIGDLNSEVDDPPTAVGPDAAPRLLDADFEDLGPEGLTCCQDSDLRNTTSDLSSRIDLVLGRGGFTTVDGVVTGNQPLRPSQPGLVQYGSDHAGVTATVVLPR